MKESSPGVLLKGLRDVLLGERFTPTKELDIFKSRVQNLFSAVKLSPEEFEALVGVDTTFGGFGIAVPQEDPFLHLVALTAFQPYEDAIVRDPDDAMGVLTPLYRCLRVLAILTMHRLGLEGTDKTDIERMLPYKPKTSYADSKYSSLLEVVCSFWIEICHAYIEPIGPDLLKVVIPQDDGGGLFCYDTNRSRASCIWLDLNTNQLERCINDSEGGKLDANVPLVRLVHTTFDLSDKAKEVINVAFLGLLEDGSKSAVCTFTSKKNRDPAETIVSDSIELEGFMNQPSSMPDETGIMFSCIAEPPYVQLAEGDTRRNFFLLVTMGGGNFSGFYRCTAGHVIMYPLYFHQVSSSQGRSHDNDNNNNNGDPRVVKRCCVCNKSRDDGVVMIQDSFDATPEGRDLWYCSSKCIVQMSSIRASRMQHERAKSQASRGSRIPLVSHTDPYRE